MTYDFGKFKKLDEKALLSADEALQQGIPELLRQLGQELDARAAHEREMQSAFMDSGIGACSRALLRLRLGDTG
jgi:hypothetical protein